MQNRLCIVHVRFLNNVGGVEAVLSGLAALTATAALDLRFRHSYILLYRGHLASHAVSQFQAGNTKFLCISSPSVYYQFISSLRKAKPVCILFHGAPPFLIALSSTFLRCHKIYCDHGTIGISAGLVSWLKYRAILVFEIKLFCKAVIANSRHCAETISSVLPFGKQVLIVYPGVICKSLMQKSTKVCLDNPKILRLGYLGRVSFTDKGADMLVSILKTLCEQGLSVHLTIAGDGADMNALKAMFHSAGLGPFVSFRGVITNKVDFFSGIDILVTPSRLENFGLSPLEAISSLVPVVCFKVGGLVEALDGLRCVHFVKPFCITSFCFAIIRCWRELPHMSMQLSSDRKNILHRFSAESYASSLEHSISLIIGG